MEPQRQLGRMGRAAQIGLVRKPVGREAGEGGSLGGGKHLNREAFIRHSRC